MTTPPIREGDVEWRFCPTCQVAHDYGWGNETGIIVTTGMTPEPEPPFTDDTDRTYFVTVLAAVDVGFTGTPTDDELRDALLDGLADQIQQRVISGDGIEIEFSHVTRNT